MLATVLTGSRLLRSEPLPGIPDEIERAVRELHLEGVVAKRLIDWSNGLDSDNACFLFPPPYNLIGVDPKWGLSSSTATRSLMRFLPAARYRPRLL